jgi:hypothetical protein
MAPGTSTTTRLSIASMIAIETVSPASAVVTTVPSARPARTSGIDVSE